MSMVPYVVEQTSRGERSYDIFSRLLNDRIVMLSEEVNDTTASLIVAQFLYLKHRIRIRIFNFISIAQVDLSLRAWPFMIQCNILKRMFPRFVLVWRLPWGAFLLSAGAKGKRLALPNAEIMIHQPSGGSQGQATDIQIQAERILRMKKKLNRILSENTGKPLDIIERDCERDFFMNAEEAKAYGLIDEVISHR